MGVTNLQQIGNQILINFSDGTKTVAYPTSGGLWVVASADIPPVNGTFIWPFPVDTVSSEYRSADRPTHDGIDFAYNGIEGDDIPSSGDGVVVAYSTNHSGYGNYVAIESVVGEDTLRLLYAHMQTAPYVNLGDSVIQGQIIGIVGQTGASQGDHLHWETKVNGSYVNPRDFMATYA